MVWRGTFWARVRPGSLGEHPEMEIGWESMSTEIVKDGQVIGYIETRIDGKLVAKDTRYRIRGYYDAETNQTRDFTYKIVGQGNLLASMVTGPY